MITRRKPVLQDRLDLEVIAATPCKSKDDVIVLLRAVLHELGGDQIPHDEPGLSASARRVEDALRSAIHFLIVTGCWTLVRHSKMAYLIPPKDWISFVA